MKPLTKPKKWLFWSLVSSTTQKTFSADIRINVLQLIRQVGTFKVRAFCETLAWTWWFVYAMSWAKKPANHARPTEFTPGKKPWFGVTKCEEYGECPEAVKLPWANSYETACLDWRIRTKRPLAAAGEVGWRFDSTNRWSAFCKMALEIKGMLAAWMLRFQTFVICLTSKLLQAAGRFSE